MCIVSMQGPRQMIVKANGRCSPSSRGEWPIWMETIHRWAAAVGVSSIQPGRKGNLFLNFVALPTYLGLIALGFLRNYN